MSESNPSVRVHVNIEISAASLQAVVANTKHKAAADPQGRYRVDTADALADLISRFLREQGFDEYTRNLDNY